MSSLPSQIRLTTLMLDEEPNVHVVNSSALSTTLKYVSVKVTKRNGTKKMKYISNVFDDEEDL